MPFQNKFNKIITEILQVCFQLGSKEEKICIYVISDCRVIKGLVYFQAFVLAIGSSIFSQISYIFYILFAFCEKSNINIDYLHFII